MQHGSSITIMQFTYKKKMITSLQFTYKKKNDYKFAIYNFSKT